MGLFDTVKSVAFKLISSHEGLRLFPYTDTDGSQTIGYGTHINTIPLKIENYLLDKHPHIDIRSVYRFGITIEDAEVILRDRIDFLYFNLKIDIPWIVDLSKIRQAVLLDMAYNMGIGSWGKNGLLGFTKFLAYLRDGKYFEAAAIEMARSEWMKQVPSRASNDAKLMEMGR